MTTPQPHRHAYTSAADLYPARYRDGEHLTVRPARMFTGQPDTPETPGLAIETGRHRLIACITLEHAVRLHDLLHAALGVEDTTTPN